VHGRDARAAGGASTAAGAPETTARPGPTSQALGCQRPWPGWSRARGEPASGVGGSKESPSRSAPYPAGGFAGGAPALGVMSYSLCQIRWDAKPFSGTVSVALGSLHDQQKAPPVWRGREPQVPGRCQRGPRGWLDRGRRVGGGVGACLRPTLDGARAAGGPRARAGRGARLGPVRAAQGGRWVSAWLDRWNGEDGRRRASVAAAPRPWAPRTLALDAVGSLGPHAPAGGDGGRRQVPTRPGDGPGESPRPRRDVAERDQREDRTPVRRR
jgi:hypothetical protein